MSCTIEKILADARLLVNRLKDHDSCADNLISQTTTLHKRIDAMKQYEEDMNELNEIARHRPRANLILGLAQENSQIRELQQENKDLRVSLEEHQSALELIMSKYREQIFKLVMANQLDKSAIAKKDIYNHDMDKIDKICEMAAVMRKAIEVDDQQGTQEQELISQLKMENRTLREVLRISEKFTVVTDEKDTQTGHSDSESDGLNDSVIEVCDTNTIKRKPSSSSDLSSEPQAGESQPGESTKAADTADWTDSGPATDSNQKIVNINEDSSQANQDENANSNANSS